MCKDRELQAGEKIKESIEAEYRMYIINEGRKPNVCLLDPVSFRLFCNYLKSLVGKYNPRALPNLKDDIFSPEYAGLKIHRVTTLVYSKPILCRSQKS